jgi:hypothetical protein
MELIMEALWGEDRLADGPERTYLENVFLLLGAWPQTELVESDLHAIRVALGIPYPLNGLEMHLDPFHRVRISEVYRPTLTHMEMEKK